MDLEEARTLIAYTRWANLKVLEAASRLPTERLAQPAGGNVGSLLDTLRHMVGAESVWLERCLGRSPASFPAGETLCDIDAVSGRWSEVADGYERLLAGLDEGALSRGVSYSSFAGQPFVQPLGHLLRHVVNHSTYHRGQVTLLLRLLGTSGVGTDLVAFYRERS